MRIYPDILDNLYHIAEQMPQYDDVGNGKLFRVAAAVVSGKKILTTGTNERKTHPLQARFAKNEYAIYMHAEVSAIADAIKLFGNDYRKEMRNLAIYVARAKRIKANDGGNTKGLAKPCAGCMRLIKHCNFRMIVYTTDTGDYAVEDLAMTCMAA